MMKQELVRDWMTREVITIPQDATLSEAEQLMITHMIRRLPVVRDGRIVGIVTYGDIRNARPSRTTALTMWESNFMAARIEVSEFMTHNPVTISQEATIGEAAQLMLKYMVSGLPVVDDSDNLAGIITESDIFRLVAREWSKLDTVKSPA